MMFGEETVNARQVVVFYRTSWGTQPFTRGGSANFAPGKGAIFLSQISILSTQNICITFIQCWIRVEDVGPTLFSLYTNGLRLLGLEVIS